MPVQADYKDLLEGMLAQTAADDATVPADPHTDGSEQRLFATLIFDKVKARCVTGERSSMMVSHGDAS